LSSQLIKSLNNIPC